MAGDADGLDGARRPGARCWWRWCSPRFTLITLDYHGGNDSPVEPVRAAVGEVFGPVEGATAAIRPFMAVPDYLRTTTTCAATSPGSRPRTPSSAARWRPPTSTATGWPSWRA